MEVKEILNEYKQVTIKLLNTLDNDLTSAQNYVNERGQYIDKLKLLNIDKEEFKKIYCELGIAELEEKAMKMLKVEKEKTNVEIIKLKRNREANQVYNNVYKNINFFNRTI